MSTRPMDRTFDAELVLEARDVADLPWRVLPGNAGVTDKVLCESPDGKSSAGVMAIAPGAGVRLHRHRRGTHHTWVARGSCRVADRTLTVGSYAHVPPGAPHGVQEAGPEGCLLFFLYLE